jgi:hypothetical protein
MKTKTSKFVYRIRLVAILMLAAVSSASCTYTKSFANLQLDESIGTSGFTSVNLIQHSVTPGAIVLLEGDNLTVACDWPSVLAKPPATVVTEIAVDKYEAKALRLFARDQALAKTLDSIFEVESIQVGPLIQTTLEPGALASSANAVATRCREQLIATRETSKLVLFADGTMSVDVVFTLSPRAPELAKLLEPMLPNWASAFGDFMYDPATAQLSGRLVKAFRASPDDVYALLLEPSDDEQQYAYQRYATTQESMAGIWIIDRWKSPASRGPSTNGTLTVGSQREDGKYDGVFTFFLEGKEKIIEEVVIIVDDDRVTMEGTVIEGRDLWTDDNLNLTFTAPNVLSGTVTSRSDRTATRVTLVKSSNR